MADCLADHVGKILPLSSCRSDRCWKVRPEKAGMLKRETDPPGKESEPRSLGCRGGGNEADEANRQSRPWDGERVAGP